MDFLPLDEHGAVAKSSESLTGGSLKLLDALVDVVDDPHTSTAATIGRFQDHRAAVLGDELESLLRRVDRLVGAGDDGEAGGDGGLPGGHLVAHLGHYRPFWTDEPDAGLDTSVGEVRSLGQEPVARVDGVHIMLLVNKIRVKDVIISRC